MRKRDADPRPHDDTVIYSKTYHSIGGGFIVLMKSISAVATNEVTVPYPFKSAKEMLEYCNSTGLSFTLRHGDAKRTGAA